MKLFTAIYHDVQLLGHFLARYRRAGVTDFFIAADPRFEHAVIEFASEYSMTVVSYLDVADTVIGGVSAVTEMRRRHQHDTEWVVIVDLDEFVEFLFTIEQVIACAERESANVVDAIMGDGFSLDGRVRGLQPDDDLPRIYPMRARFIRDVMCGCDIKGVLVKGLLASNVVHHTFRGEIICSKVLNISHYKWTEGSIDRLRTAYRMAVAAGLPWGRRVRQDPEVLPPAWPICMAGVRRGTDCCHSIGSAPMASSDLRGRADYGAQCRAARELAVEYFSAQAVLAPLLEAAFAGAQPPPEPDLPKGNGSEVRRHGKFDGVAW